MTSINPAISLYRRILKRFPQEVAFCFAYGSGVKSQLGYENRKISDNVLDFVISVDDDKLAKWHTDNIRKNENDYSALGKFGGGFVSKYQRFIPANVYFNTLIPVPEENVTIKYGVVATNHLIRDCNEWTYLYLAGRLQKPVTIVSETVPDGINTSLQSNLGHALSTALLLLPERFTGYELFYKIAQLSYRGDFRMVFGENPNKVQNIVKPQVQQFLSLYKPEISKKSDVLQIVASSANDDVTFVQDISPKAVESLMREVPKNHRVSVQHKEYSKELANSLARTVFKSSAIQSIKNIPTAGLIKSIRYSYSKAKKTFS